MRKSLRQSLVVLRKSFIKRYFTPRFTFAKVELMGLVIFAAGAIFGLYVLTNKLIVSLIQSAGEVTESWDFTVPGDYAVSDSEFIQVTGNAAKLLSLQYTSDANTQLLLHLDEGSGTTATDSSSYANNGTLTNASWITAKLDMGVMLTGSKSYISLPDSAALSFAQSNTLEAWTKFGSSFNSTSHLTKQAIFDKGQYQLYYDNLTGKLTYELGRSNATSWAKVAGDEVNGSWDLGSFDYIFASTTLGTDLYVGFGNSTADGDVWRWKDSAWQKIAGSGEYGSWGSEIEKVSSLTSDGTYVYAGLGTSGSPGNDADVWRWNGSAWTKIGGDGLNGSWTLSEVPELAMHNTTLLAASYGELYSWNGTTWTKIGIKGTSWPNEYNDIYSITSDGTNIYIGMGANTGNADVYRYNGSTWTKIGGDTLNSSWASSTYETVDALVYGGTKLYAGLGFHSGDGEVWEWNGTAWAKIGGDGLNSSIGAEIEYVRSMYYAGSTLYVGTGDNGNDAEVWTWNGSVWAKIGGDGNNSSWPANNEYTRVMSLTGEGSNVYASLYVGSYAPELWHYNGSTWQILGGNGVNSSWGIKGLSSITALESVNGKLYAGMQGDRGVAQIWEFDGSAWTIVGGQGVKNSWTYNTYEVVLSTVAHQGNLVVGLGSTVGDGEVWSYNGTTWTKLGGDGASSSWNTNYEGVYSLMSDGTYLYAGLGNNGGDAELWRWNGSIWAQIAGDNINSSWNSYATLESLIVFNGEIFAGFSGNHGEADVYRLSSGTWTKVGGDGVNSSWAAQHNNTRAFAVYNNELYTAVGGDTGEAELWRWNGSSWTQIGGDGVNGSWVDSIYENVYSLAVYNGELYAGLGFHTDDGEMWKYDGSTWTKVGGDSVNNSWSSIEGVYSLSTYEGKLYAGLGNGYNDDAEVWAYGNNAVLKSTFTSQDTNWHHIAATYDGTTMKLYRDGVLDNTKAVSLTISDTNLPLYLGASYGGLGKDDVPGYFNGSLDEVRISNIARTSFNTNAYSADPQTVNPVTAGMDSGVQQFDTFDATETTNGGSIKYRLSNDDGTTWKYWNGSVWATSSTLSQANTEAETNANIVTFPVTIDGLKWQAILTGNGDQQVILEDVTITASGDTAPPSNPDTVVALDQAGGDTQLTTNTWYDYTAPEFTWTGADDNGGSGVEGYFVYFGLDNTADPETAGNFQTGNTYVPATLTTNGSYYLKIKTRDIAQNISATADLFLYKLDTNPPINPSLISVSPAGYSATNSYTFFWPSSGDAAASDGTGSGVAGYQYKTGASSGVYSNWSDTLPGTSITLPDAAYQEGANIFYLRTVDNVGKISTATIQVNYYFSGAAPTAPLNIVATPSVNTVNAFAFSWDPPASYSGNENELTYCYTVNIVPQASTCTFTEPGVTSLPQDAYATQPGINIFYVIARDGLGNINYDTYQDGNVQFTANTSAPGIPTDLEAADVSIKATQSWKIATSWEPPADVGAGIDSYKIFSSTDGTSFTEIAETSGTAYVDTGIPQLLHYYKIKACDSVNNCGAFSSVVSLFPDGKFTEPPELTSGPVSTEVTTKSAKIHWTTNRTADSKVQYGLVSGEYYEEEPSNSTMTTDHNINLNNLEPGTTYYYRAKWTDEDGNTGTSLEKVFTTEPPPSVKNVTVRSIGLNNAILQFTTTGASKAKVYFGTSVAFGGAEEVQTAITESTYTVELRSLTDGAKYFYKVNTFDGGGAEYEGTILDFTTLPRPKISTVRLQQVVNTSQTTVLVTWESNTDITSVISFNPVDDPTNKREEVNLDLVKGEHSMLIRGLLPDTEYVLTVLGTDKIGNQASSEPQRFTTATDTRPPQVFNVDIIGGTLPRASFTSGDAKAQLVVTWDTDEPSTSQVEYGEGSGTTYSQKTQEEDELTTNHTVIVSNLTPSQVYHLRVVSKDKVGNVTKSLDLTTIAPKVNKSAFDLVILNLGQLFALPNR